MTPNMAEQQTASDINTISAFLANAQLKSLDDSLLTTHGKRIEPSVVVLAGSGILHLAHIVFTHLESCIRQVDTASAIKILVITGGMGHSTTHLYTAIQNHPVYRDLPRRAGLSTLDGQSEAKLLYLIFTHFHNGEEVVEKWNVAGAGKDKRLTVLVEEESTNCGANATQTKLILKKNGINFGAGADSSAEIDPLVVAIVQDPTMSLRTKACFEKSYELEVESGRLVFCTFPTFVPKVRIASSPQGSVEWDRDYYDAQGVDVHGLWGMDRFYGLVLGEIPRLRNDKNGYGPSGKGFIPNVPIPSEVELAAQRLNHVLEQKR